MRTTPSFVLCGGKPRRKYIFCCIWQHELNTPSRRHALSWLSTELQQCHSSRSVYEGIFGGIPDPLATGLKCVRLRKQPSTSSYIQDISRLSRLSRTWESPRSLYWMLLASYTIGHCLDPEDGVGKWDKVNSAECHRTLTRGPATTRSGFRASEGQLKVRRLVTSAVVDSCLNYIVESRILKARYVFELVILWYFCDSDPRFCYLFIFYT